MKTKIGVVGLWHLGCVLSASWNNLGYQVYGFDYDKQKIDNLEKGIPPLFEPDLEDHIKKGLSEHSLSFSNKISDLCECNYIFLTYDTPVNENDESDTSILEKSVDDLIKIMKNGAILIVSSQSPVGYCATLREKLQSEKRNLDIAYSPENLRLGEAIKCYLEPGRIILGTADKNVEKKCLELFGSITSNVICMNLESSEMVKHGINSFLANSIVFTNNLADICEEKGANISDVVKGMKSDDRIGKKAYLSPGTGFSGGTLGRDLKVLEGINNASNGYAKLFGYIHSLNKERKNSIVKKVEYILGDLTGKTIGVLGLTYKPGTSTLRRSNPLEIIDLILAKKSNVKVFDPKADYSELNYLPEFKICKNIKEVAENSDMLLLLTEWKDFKEFNWSDIKDKMNNPVFFDTKNFLDENNMNDFTYYSIGRKK